MLLLHGNYALFLILTTGYCLLTSLYWFRIEILPLPFMFATIDRYRRLKFSYEIPIRNTGQQRILGRGEDMYSFMVLNSMCRTLYRDFLSYYKRNPEDDFYIVSVNNPKLAQYLEEFIERRLN